MRRMPAPLKGKQALFLDDYGTVVHHNNEYLLRICQQIADAANRECTVLEVGHYWWRQQADLSARSYGEQFRKPRELMWLSLEKTLEYFEARMNVRDDVLLQQTIPQTFSDAVSFIEHVPVPVYIMSNIERDTVHQAQNKYKLPITGIITSEDVKA